MEMSIEEWRAVARGICESTGADASLPHLLRKVVERLQQQEINLTADRVQLESQLSAALHVRYYLFLCQVLFNTSFMKDYFV